MDAVYFMKGWEKARGCRIEYEACVTYGVAIKNTEKSGAMDMLAFMKIIQEAASLTKDKDMPLNETGGLEESRCAGGIDCHVHLNAQGKINDKPTAIQVSFHVPPKV